jgi:hypothetical protein
LPTGQQRIVIYDSATKVGGRLQGVEGFVDGNGTAARFNTARVVSRGHRTARLYVADDHNSAIRTVDRKAVDAHAGAFGTWHQLRSGPARARSSGK